LRIIKNDDPKGLSFFNVAGITQVLGFNSQLSILNSQFSIYQHPDKLPKSDALDICRQLSDLQTAELLTGG